MQMHGTATWGVWRGEQALPPVTPTVGGSLVAFHGRLRADGPAPGRVMPALTAWQGAVVPSTPVSGRRAPTGRRRVVLESTT